ncbi:MAG: hypothetical protein R3C49_20680 [Planctomycetaceae bacterium]
MFTLHEEILTPQDIRSNEASSKSSDIWSQAMPTQEEPGDNRTSQSRMALREVSPLLLSNCQAPA